VQVQKTHFAKLHPDAVALVVRFGLKFLPMSQALHACAGASDDVIAKTRSAVTQFIQQVLDGQAVELVAQRYARNVLNARWLWRNRTMASRVTVNVYEGGKDVQEQREPLVSADALTVPLTRFNDPTEAETKLAARFAKGLRGQSLEGFEVEAIVDFGTRGAVEVFPSQVYDGVPRESKSIKDPSRVLYMHKHADADRSIGELGQAAIRDAKINNALRTFDTWYPDFEEVGQPMPIEPEGASIDMQLFFRKQGKDGKSAFNLIRNLETLDPTSDDGLFMAAALIRAGVYGAKESAKPGEASNQPEVEAA
jgi:CRISPR-associated protein Csy3